MFVVRDVMKAVAYFRDALGFHTEFLYGEPTFYVFVADVDALYSELKDRGAKLLNEPRDYPYGMRDFNVQDLDGNDLCFGMESKREP